MKHFLLFVADLHLERLAQPIILQGSFPTGRARAKVCATAILFACLVNDESAFRRAYDAHQLPLGLYLATPNARPLGNVLTPHQ
jgi:hypothetical protein